MKKILFLTNCLPPAGGAETVAWELAIKSAENKKTHVFTFGNERITKVIDNVTVHFFPKGNHTLRHYLTFGRKNILSVYKKITPDVIHAHGNSLFAHILRKKKGVNKIATFHHSYLHEYSWSKFKFLKFKYFSNQTVKHYNILTTVSIHMQKYFTDMYKKNVLFIPNGYNNQFFYFDSVSERKSKSVLFVGQLTNAKGVDILLRLAVLMPDYTFTFVGKGVLKNVINKKNINFVGEKNAEDLRKYYNLNTYSIFPSKYENFPLVGLEAMACGSIVIASDKGFYQYIEHKQNGFLITSPDECRIKEAILGNKDVDMIRKNALTTVEKYTWEQIFNKYDKFYNN